MAKLFIDQDRLVAGRRYLQALQRLGLDPNGFFWIQEGTQKAFTLMLITEQYDEVGPLVLSETLFEAYRHYVTPPEIDPFIVRLHSPYQDFIRRLNILVVSTLQAASRHKSILKDMDQIVEFDISQVRVSFLPSWIYKFDMPLFKGRSADLTSDWKRVRNNLFQIVNEQAGSGPGSGPRA